MIGFWNLYVACHTSRFRRDKYRRMDLRIHRCRVTGPWFSGTLGKLAPEANGGPFAYTKLGMGGFSAYLVAWGYWVSIWCANAAITVAAVGYLAVFFPVLGESAIVFYCNRAGHYLVLYLD